MASENKHIFRLPKLYENMDEATIGKWLIAEGEEVKLEQPLVELITDKTTVEYESPMAGTVHKHYAAERSVVPVGFALACIGPADIEIPDVSADNEKLLEAQANGEQPAPEDPAPAPKPDDDAARRAQARTQKLRVAPAARMYAKQHSVDLDAVAARLGNQTVIHRKDVETYMKQQSGDPGLGASRVVLITGASGDIGSALARRFAKDGFRVAVHYHKNKKQATMLTEEIRQAGGTAHPFAADLSDSAAANDLVEQVSTTYGQLDVVINNAGMLQDGLLSFMNDEQWLKVIDLNLNAAFYVTRAAALIMARQRSGKIINIASDAGRLGSAGRSNYAAAKAGLAGFTRAIAQELAISGVQANTVSPGFIDSQMTADIVDAKRKELIRSIPARRFGTPEDVANLVAFLASRRADYITGQEISVDGGLYMG